jgi:hypothetical protein
LGSAAVSALLQFVPSLEEAGKVGNFVSLKIKSKGESPAPSSDGKLLTELKIGKPEQYIYLFSKVTLFAFSFFVITILAGTEVGEKIECNINFAFSF